ncbi:MAG: hypothetical protein ACJAYE_001407 [Candidatus Azotimanducaceae bacterium]|jgi:hypothetical protein
MIPRRLGNFWQLSYFDVLIVPDGGDYAAVLGDYGMDNLKAWVDNGGVLITAGSAPTYYWKRGLGFYKRN